MNEEQDTEGGISSQINDKQNASKQDKLEMQLQNVSQVDFVECHYQAQAWEVIGEPPQEVKFTPNNFEVIKGFEVIKVDPMFPDYGGGSDDLIERWSFENSLEENTSVSSKIEDNSAAFTDEELELIKSEAYTTGYEECKKDLENSIEESKLELCTKFENFLLSMQTSFKDEVEIITQKAVNLSLTISKNIIDHSVEVNPEYIIKVIKEALQFGSTAKVNKIKISPDDFEFITIMKLSSSFKNNDDAIVFESDQKIKSGCVIETSSGEIDFQLDKAWERVKDQILQLSEDIHNE